MSEDKKNRKVLLKLHTYPNLHRVFTKEDTKVYQKSSDKCIPKIENSYVEQFAQCNKKCTN